MTLRKLAACALVTVLVTACVRQRCFVVTRVVARGDFRLDTADHARAFVLGLEPDERSRLLAACSEIESERAGARMGDL